MSWNTPPWMLAGPSQTPRVPVTLPIRSTFIVGGVIADLASAALLLLAWGIDRPHSEFDSIDTMGLVALATVVFCGFGWYFTSVRGCLFGCSVQLLRLVAFVLLVVVSLSAYNPHMDNPCNDSGHIDSCIDDAQRWFAWVYAALTATALFSGVLLFIKRRAGG